MAIYTTAVLVKEQAQLTGAFANSELKFSSPEVHLLFLRNAMIMIGDYQAMRTREDRVIETNYFLRSQRALTTGRTHNHTGAVGDSGTLTPAWATKADKFASTLKQADNKIYTKEQIANNELFNSMINLTEGQEVIAAAALFAARSGVNTATTDGSFNAVDDTFEITESTHGDGAMQITKMVMRINKWKGNYTVVCDPISFRKFEAQANQGAGNSTNTSFQFAGVTFVLDLTLSASAAGLVAAYAKGYWMVVPDGTIAGLPWIPLQNRMGVDDKEASYGSILNPIDGSQVAVHSYSERADGTAKGGYTQDITYETELSGDWAYEIAPLSTAGETPVQAFAFV
jgi:hypothetical protein